MVRFNKLFGYMALCIMLFSVFSIYAKTHEVTVSSNFFSPSSLSIEAGDTVRWTNDGTGSHNVFANDFSYRCALGCDAEGGDGNASLEPWVVEVTFRSSGSSAYICEPHEVFGMTGSIFTSEPQDVTVHEVFANDIPENQFSPADLTITQGEVVRFINQDGNHNIHAVDDSFVCSETCIGDGKVGETGPTGASWDIHMRFDEVGEFPYFCDAHNMQEGIIRVVSHTIFKNGFEQ